MRADPARLLGRTTAGANFADVAETVIAELMPRIAAQFANRHGVIAGGEAVVLALGKLGGREMTSLGPRSHPHLRSAGAY